MDLKELELVDPNVHWYYRSKLLALVSALSRFGFAGGALIDVGAGSGFFSIRLNQEFPNTNVVCVDPNYPDSDVRTEGRVTFTRQVGLTEKEKARLFLFIDVLEHVEDDVALLRDYVSHATPGSLVAVTVPAFMSLWSGHDVYLEHFRRYRRSQVVQLAEAAGLEVLDSRYLFGATFVPLWVVRRLTRSAEPRSQMKSVSSWLNSLLFSLVNTEHRVVRNRLAGSSVLLIARVPAQFSPVG